MSEVERQLRLERADKEQALDLRTRAVRDLKASRDELGKVKGLLARANRHAALARLLLHARSRFGR